MESQSLFSHANIQEDAAHGALQAQVISSGWRNYIFFLLCTGLGTTVGQKRGSLQKHSRGALELTASVSVSDSPPRATAFAGTLAVVCEKLDTWLPRKQAQERTRN